MNHHEARLRAMADPYSDAYAPFLNNEDRDAIEWLFAEVFAAKKAEHCARQEANGTLRSFDDYRRRVREAIRELP